MVETTEAISSKNYGTSLSKDGIRRDTHEDHEDRTQICISSQDVAKDDVTRPPTREGVSRLSSNIPLDCILKEKNVCIVTFEPEMRCNVANNNNLGNDENEIIKTNFRMRLKNRIMKLIPLLKAIPMKRM